MRRVLDFLRAHLARRPLCLVAVAIAIMSKITSVSLGCVCLSFGLTSNCRWTSWLQAGNKSLISYNGQVGIPGYTGYIPTNASLGLPVKGFAHTGRPADPSVIDKLAQRTVDPRKTSQ